MSSSITFRSSKDWQSNLRKMSILEKMTRLFKRMRFRKLPISAREGLKMLSQLMCLNWIKSQSTRSNFRASIIDWWGMKRQWPLEVVQRHLKLPKHLRHLNNNLKKPQVMIQQTNQFSRLPIIACWLRSTEVLGVSKEWPQMVKRMMSSLLMKSKPWSKLWGSKRSHSVCQ